MNMTLGTRWQIRESLFASGIVLAILLCLPIVGVLLLVLQPLFVAALVALLIGIGVQLFIIEPRANGGRGLDGIPRVEIYKGIRVARRGVALDAGHCAVWTEPCVAVGVDDYAQAIVGPVDEIELPEEGVRVERGDPLIALRRADRMIQLPAPVSGTVVSVNGALRRQPDLIQRSPFDKGWVVLIHPERLSKERSGLIAGRKARRWMRRQVDALLNSLTGRGVADDADDLRDLHDRIDDSRWLLLRRALAEQREPEFTDDAAC